MSKHRSGKTAYQFGEDGTKEVKWTGKLPSPVFGPYVSKKRYVFSERKNPRLIDLRDLPFLVKDAKRENLSGKGLPKILKDSELKPAEEQQEV